MAFMTGDAYPSGGWARGLNERHYVKVHVPTLSRPYPTTQQSPAETTGDPFVRRCPVVTFQNWQEELVMVLAHELEHVIQYETASPMDRLEEVVLDQDEQYEVAAECAADIVLSRWRAHGVRSDKRMSA